MEAYDNFRNEYPVRLYAFFRHTKLNLIYFRNKENKPYRQTIKDYIVAGCKEP